MLENEQIARIRVREALRQGLASQKAHREMPSKGSAISIPLTVGIFAIFWLVNHFLF
jgi:hypothetical protein